SDMLRSRPMTFFTIDAVHDLALIEGIAILRIIAEHRPGIRGMALQALGGDSPVVNRRIDRIAGAIAPAIQRSKIRDGQLKKLFVIPIEISLAFSAGADDDVDRSGPVLLPVPVGRLKE